MKSLERQFLDFCRSKPARRRYRYVDPEACAFAQFLRETRRPFISVLPGLWQDRFGYHKIDQRVEESLRPRRCASGSTFGALTRRLEEALGETSHA